MIVVDTSAWSRALRRPASGPPHPASELIRRLVHEGEHLAIPGIVLQELLSGVRTREQFERVKSACLRDLKALAPAATPTGGEAVALLDNLPALWAALTADEQKTLYRLMFSTIEVCDQAIVAVEARGPFRELLAGALARLDGALGRLAGAPKPVAA